MNRGGLFRDRRDLDAKAFRTRKSGCRLSSPTSWFPFGFPGGDERIWTLDPRVANAINVLL